jgi:hypothetical protein
MVDLCSTACRSAEKSEPELQMKSQDWSDKMLEFKPGLLFETGIRRELGGGRPDGRQGDVP